MQKDKHYSQPLPEIRLLVRFPAKKEEKSVIDIEHIQSGDKCRLSNVEEAALWMREIDAESAENSTERE